MTVNAPRRSATPTPDSARPALSVVLDNRYAVGLLARGIVYPRRAALAVALVLWVFSPADLMTSAVLGAVTGCGLRLYAKSILTTKSIRDRAELNSLVKSLRLRRRVLKHWPRVMSNIGQLKTNRAEPGSRPAVPQRSRVALTPLGVSLAVRIAAVSATTDDLRAKRAALESGFGAAGARVTSHSPGWSSLTLLHTDPLSRMITTDDLHGRQCRRGFVLVGVDEDSAGVEKDPTLPSLIVGGQGAGKSTELWTTLYGLLCAGVSFRLRAFDPKVMELADLKDVAHDYSNDPFGWGAFLGKALGGLAKRQRVLAERGSRKLTRFTDADPLDLIVVDELLAVISSKKQEVKWTDANGKEASKSAEDALTLFMSQGRAAGYSLLGLSQLGQKAVLGPQVADLFQYKTCLRVASDEQVSMVLGVPGASAMYPAHTIARGSAGAGIGYCDTYTDRGIVRYRAALLSEPERRWVVRELAAMKARQEHARTAARTSSA